MQFTQGFHLFIGLLLWFISNQRNNQFPVGLLAHLVERCTGIAKVFGSGFIFPSA